MLQHPEVHSTSAVCAPSSLRKTVRWMKPASTTMSLTVGLLLMLPVSAQWPPEKLSNLKVYPAETEVQDLLQSMREFSFGLGVRCQFCHVGEEGKPISSFDFASDEKEAKATARSMIRMVETINTDLLPASAKEKDPVLSVECVTCHRGVSRPQQLPDVLLAATLEAGTNGAVEKYQELRKEYYGSHSYDFSEGSLVQAAEALLQAKQPDSAVALLEINLEHHPESEWTLSTLAQARSLNQDKEGAIRALKKLLELRPDDPRVKKQIEDLSSAKSP